MDETYIKVGATGLISIAPSTKPDKRWSFCFQKSATGALPEDSLPQQLNVTLGQRAKLARIPRRF